MEYINSALKAGISGGSMIRRMFEAGIELKKQYGEDQVCDFSLGNPDLPPPPAVKSALETIAANAGRPFSIGYMPNAGYPALRDKLAARVSREQECEVPGSNLLLTCGAAGGINVLFHAILDPGDEVIAPTPYFVEYDSYVANHGGTLRRAPSKEVTFELDIAAFERAASPKTRAIILNSPNNPTGRIYSRDELLRLAEFVGTLERKYDRAVYVISDEPYRFLNFDGLELPSFFNIFRHAVVIGSFSKNLSLAGERLGYVAVSPKVAGAAELMAALILCNRTLGFVNAPALGQQILLAALGAEVDLEVYRARRDAMIEVLDGAGLEYARPQGAFYVFPKSPVPDDRRFVDALFAERILAVPGSGFGRAGYIRLAFCVDESVIRRSAEGFRRAVAALR